MELNDYIITIALIAVSCVVSTGFIVDKYSDTNIDEVNKASTACHSVNADLYSFDSTTVTCKVGETIVEVGYE